MGEFWDANCEKISDRVLFRILVNSPLGNHLNDFEKFEDSLTPKVSSFPNFSKNIQSNTANARIFNPNSESKTN